MKNKIIYITIGIFTAVVAQFIAYYGFGIGKASNLAMINSNNGSSSNNPSVNIQSSTVSDRPIFQNNGPVNVDNSALSPYFDVATLNYQGLQYNQSAGAGIKFTSYISDTIGNYVGVGSDSKMTILCSPSSTIAFKDVISENPKYPYTYYYAGWCQQLLGFPTSTWKTTMKPAYDILKITTQIPDHDPTQDNLYSYLKSLY